jgi:hypothetical protein
LAKIAQNCDYKIDPSAPKNFFFAKKKFARKKRFQLTMTESKKWTRAQMLRPAHLLGFADRVTGFVDFSHLWRLFTLGNFLK